MNQSSSPDIVHIGVDVSAQWLDIARLPKTRRLANNAPGHARLLKQLPAQAHVVLEASGGYEKALWLALLRAGRPVSRIHPGRVRHFAKANMKLAKTDAIDAALLAEFGATLRPPPDTLPSQAQLELNDLVARREQLVEAQARQQVQLLQLEHPTLATQARELLAVFQSQIKELDKRIAEMLRAESILPKAQRLQQVQGVGPTVSATLLASLPELGQIQSTRIASLVGLAPHPYDSGPCKGQRHIQGGRKRVRRVLYMAALSCIRHNLRLKTFYLRLLKRGKPFKVAITAVMRKLICLLNRLLSDPTFTLAK